MRHAPRAMIALLSTFAGITASAGDEPNFRIWIRTPDSALALRRAALAAHRKLQDPRCRTVLSEFKDAAGNTLQQNLEKIGLSPSEYLTFVVFMDARDMKPSASSRCQKIGTVAIAQPGGRIVGVCSEKLVRLVAQSDGGNLVIHETLHTLGLGEDPPSSAAIDAAVTRRCGR